MIARQSVWTDSEVKKLTAKFIPAAAEVRRLQSGKDAECRLFRKIAEQGHYAGRTRPSRTRQGTYATTVDGTFLASWNKNDPRYVARDLREALKNWVRLKVKGRKFLGEDPLEITQRIRADRFFPDGGLVLKEHHLAPGSITGAHSISPIRGAGRHFAWPLHSCNPQAEAMIIS